MGSPGPGTPRHFCLPLCLGESYSSPGGVLKDYRVREPREAEHTGRYALGQAQCVLREVRGLWVWGDSFQGISFRRDGSGVWEGAEPVVLILAQEGQWSRGETGSSVRVAHWAEPVCPPGVFMLP